jgi:ADP-ribose pyrophosphatase
MAKIPSHAKKVFSGEIFDVYQWDQEMFDGSKKIFEAAGRPHTALVIPVIDDKIVLSYERQPGKDWHLTFLWGRLESGEDPVVGAKRELEEEAGMISDNFVLCQSFSPASKMDYVLYYYIAKDCIVHGNQSLDIGGEELELRYVSFDEFIDFVQSVDCRDVDFANYIFRLEKEGKLEEFRTLLFS